MPLNKETKPNLFSDGVLSFFRENKASVIFGEDFF